VDKINWDILSGNPNAIHLLEQNINNEEINWRKVSSNPNAVDLLERHPNKILWDFLTTNPNPKAICLLEQNMNKIKWNSLPYNPNAYHLIEMHLDKVNYLVSSNPSIFVIDYAKMKERMVNLGFAEELTMKVWNPTRLLKLCSMYQIQFDTLMEILA